MNETKDRSDERTSARAEEQVAKKGVPVRTALRAGYAEAEAPVYAPGQSADYPQGS